MAAPLLPVSYVLSVAEEMPIYVAFPLQGLFYSIENFLNNEKWAHMCGLSTGIAGKTFIVQGFGNVGLYSAHFLCKGGAKCVGVIEADGSIYNPDGIDIQALQVYRLVSNHLSFYRLRPLVGVSCSNPCLCSRHMVEFPDSQELKPIPKAPFWEKNVTFLCPLQGSVKSRLKMPTPSRPNSSPRVRTGLSHRQPTRFSRTRTSS